MSEKRFGWYTTPLKKAETDNADLRRQLARAQAANARLREALRPFAEHAAILRPTMLAKSRVHHWYGNEARPHILTAGDFYRAAAALNPPAPISLTVGIDKNGGIPGSSVVKVGGKAIGEAKP